MGATAGAALRNVHCCPAAADRRLLREPRPVWSRIGCGRISVRPRGITGAGFSDEGHLRYYASPARCGGMKEQKEVVKRRARLVEGLAALQAMGAGLDLAIAGRELEEGQMTVTEAADVLLAQLELLRAKEKEMKKKKKKKEEKKMKMKACNESESSEEQEEMKRNKMKREAAMEAVVKKAKNCGQCEDSSTSSSSESSDSDCEDEVIDVSNLRTAPQDVLVTGKVLTETPPENELNLPVMVSKVEDKTKDVNDASKCSPDPECISTSIASGVNSNASTCCSSSIANSTSTSTSCSRIVANGVNSNASSCCSTSTSSKPVVMAAEATAPMERIEVCMGGKCKKSGAMELMQEFERRVGIEGAVVGCKCMGKCRDGPNVRVRDMYNGEGDETPKATRNPLCIGVGLDDVGTIVANFFAEKKDMGGLLAA